MRGDSRKWLQCCEEGHIDCRCPKKGSGSKNPSGNQFTGRGTGGGKKMNLRNTGLQQNKKFHCAFHRDAANRLCTSWNDLSLKYASEEVRIKALFKNGECELCYGDCSKSCCLANQK